MVVPLRSPYGRSACQAVSPVPSSCSSSIHPRDPASALLSIVPPCSRTSMNHQRQRHSDPHHRWAAPARNQGALRRSRSKLHSGPSKPAVTPISERRRNLTETSVASTESTEPGRPRKKSPDPTHLHSIDGSCAIASDTRGDVPAKRERPPTPTIRAAKSCRLQKRPA
jgi:hypothetical protein